MSNAASNQTIEPGERAVLLGHLSPHGLAWSLTLDPRPGGKLRGLGILPAWIAFFRSLDPTAQDRVYTEEQTILLRYFEAEGAVRILPPIPEINDLDFVPVVREGIALDGGPSGDGWAYRTDSGTRFVITELGLRLLSRIDAQTALRVLVDQVQDAILADPEEAAIVARDEAAGASLAAHLVNEALQLMKTLAEAGVVTLEPAD